MAFDLTPPESAGEILSDPAKIRNAFAALSSLQNLRVDLTTAGANTRFPLGLIGMESGQAILPLPLQLPNGIDDAFNTTASVRTQLNLLLAALRAAKYLPG